MPDTSTEVALATTTLSSAANSITFSSIPGTYTDLRVVFVRQNTAGGSTLIRFNGTNGSSTAYSQTRLTGDGSSATSGRTTSDSLIGNFQGSSTQPSFDTYDIFSYAGSTNKTVLCTSSNDFNGSGDVVRVVGLYSSTSAITSITLQCGTGGTATYAAGTTATLYGIL